MLIQDDCYILTLLACVEWFSTLRLYAAAYEIHSVRKQALQVLTLLEHKELLLLLESILYTQMTFEILTHYDFRHPPQIVKFHLEYIEMDL